MHRRNSNAKKINPLIDDEEIGLDGAGHQSILINYNQSLEVGGGMKLDEKSGSLHADSLGDHGTRNKVANYSSALEIPYQDTAVDTFYKDGKNLESR